MALLTTTIGAYPKPPWLEERGWRPVDGRGDRNDAYGFTYGAGTEADSSGRDRSADEPSLEAATARAVEDQVVCGIDVPTDGEQGRDNYIHYHCRHLAGIDFGVLTRTVHRAGAAVADLPTITGPVRAAGPHFLDEDYRRAQQWTDRPVKLTVPGPLTIMDTTADGHYRDDPGLATDLADALNHEILALARAGCTQIQIDEPVFARNPDAALGFGVAALDRCLAGLGPDVTTTVHVCCGYPRFLDDLDYPKADPDAYLRLAPALDSCRADQISIEDAHRPNDLAMLERFERSTIVLGCVAIARRRVETTDEISRRIGQALDHIDHDRLVVAPDCGLLMLDRELAMAKLTNLCRGAAAIEPTAR